MKNKLPIRIKTIQAFHQLRELPKPDHPLISVVDYSLIKDKDIDSWILDFYSISMKRTTNAKIKYGQQDYDTNLTVSEIAYELGFEHSQSFSKLFKSKTSFSPLGFRQSFNWHLTKTSKVMNSKFLFVFSYYSVIFVL